MSPLFNTLATEMAGKVVMLAFVIPATLILALVLQPAGDGHVAGAGAVSSRRWCWPGCCASSGDTGWRCWPSGPRGPMRCWPCRMRWSFCWRARWRRSRCCRDRSQTVAIVLPFRYMVGFPVEVLMGQLTAGELVVGFAMQLGWLLVAVGLYQFVWRRGLRRYSAVGG